MAIKPGAQWVGPVPNRTPGAMSRPFFGLVLHIEQGSETATDGWFHNPKAQASAHFGNPKTGPLQQFVDTNDKAWAEVAGNSRWASVEHEGYSGQALTASQIENDAELYAWLHVTEHVPLATTNDINTPGLGWHGMGGNLWGGHFQCPGEPVKAARGEILKRALEIVHQPTPNQAANQGRTPSAVILHPAQKKAEDVPTFPGLLKVGSTGEHVRELQAQLRRRGWRVTVDGEFGPNTERVVAAFQAQKHLKVDGAVGPVTWHALFVTTVTHH